MARWTPHLGTVWRTPVVRRHISVPGGSVTVANGLAFPVGGGALGAVDRAWADVQCRQGGHEGLGLAVAGEVQAGGVEARVVGVVHVEQQQLQQLGAEA